MTEVIYLVIDKYTVKKMTKNLPRLNTGEHVIKVDVTVKPEAYRDPVVSQHIVIEDWREGVDISDVEFKQPYISEEEAGLIREKRLQDTLKMFEAKGYKVQKIEETE